MPYPLFNKNTPIISSNIYISCTNLTLKFSKTLEVLAGKINNDKPIIKEIQPISVIIKRQSGSQILCVSMFKSPIIMAINDIKITNF